MGEPWLFFTVAVAFKFAQIDGEVWYALHFLRGEFACIRMLR